MIEWKRDTKLPTNIESNLGDEIEIERSNP